MSGRKWITLAFFLLVCSVATPALAQETRFELAVGPHYPLVSQKLDIDQRLSWHARFGVRYTPRLTVSAVAEVMKTSSDLPNRPDGDLDIGLYGLQGTWVFTGETDFQLVGTAAVGKGKFNFDPVDGLSAADSRSTDVKFWYEGGVGAVFGLSRHWGMRFQLTLRGLEPDTPVPVLSGTRFMFVPSLDFMFRF